MLDAEGATDGSTPGSDGLGLGDDTTAHPPTRANAKASTPPRRIGIV
jgi:hypothetical protein